jgi:hypothetical protein
MKLITLILACAFLVTALVGTIYFLITVFERPIMLLPIGVTVCWFVGYILSEKTEVEK